MIDRSKKLQARFYETALGRKPVREWLLNLSEDDRRIVGKDIQKVEFGWPIGMPYCRSLGHGLWEVRSDLTGGKIGRVIFSIVADEMALLHGFVKDPENALQGHRPRSETEKRGELMKRKRKGRIARDETFDDFLASKGVLAESEELALKEIIADQIKAAMKVQGITKTAMAARMRTDRRQLDRLLDPDNQSVTLSTLRRAANAVGRSLRVELV